MIDARNRVIWSTPRITRKTEHELQGKCCETQAEEHCEDCASVSPEAKVFEGNYCMGTYKAGEHALRWRCRDSC